MAHTRSKAAREAEYHNTARCPEPCAKQRFITRASAKRYARYIAGAVPGAASRPQRAYAGHTGTCCEGFFHLTASGSASQTEYYRGSRAFARDSGLPPGWQVSARKVSTRRWGYAVHVPGEPPMHSVYSYMSEQAALAEAVADVLGESREAV